MLELLVDEFWMSGHLQLQALQDNSSNVAVVLGVAPSEAANRKKCSKVTGLVDQKW